MRKIDLAGVLADQSVRAGKPCHSKQLVTRPPPSLHSPHITSKWFTPLDSVIDTMVKVGRGHGWYPLWCCFDVNAHAFTAGLSEQGHDILLLISLG